MAPVVAYSAMATVGTGRQGEATPSRLTTTLYDLVAALREVAEADDAQVVATLVHLLRSGRLTWVGPARRPRGLSQRAAMWTRQRVSPQTTAERFSSTSAREEHTVASIPQ